MSEEITHLQYRIRILLPVILGVLALLIEADRDVFAQAEHRPSLELLEVQKSFTDYQKDFLDFANSSAKDTGLEYSVAMELFKIAAENNERIGATTALLFVYENVHCKDDLARIRPLLGLDLSMYSKQINLDVESANRQISSTQSPGVAAEATHMRDDLREAKGILDSIKLQ